MFRQSLKTNTNHHNIPYHKTTRKIERIESLSHLIKYNRQWQISMKKTPEQIHYNMSRIRSKDTKIEVILRKELWSRGIRYRKNVKDVFGKPDIAFKSKKVAIFCDSEFFHGYDWDHRKKDLKTNKEFWIVKIEHNIERDREVNKTLENDGWIVLRYWGKRIKNDVKGIADEIEEILETAGTGR